MEWDMCEVHWDLWVKLLQCNFMTWVLIVISSIIFLDQLDKRNSSLTKLAVIGTKVIKKKKLLISLFLLFFLIQFLKFTLCLQLLQSIGYIPHVVQYMREPILHPISYTSHSSTLLSPPLLWLVTTSLSVSLHLFCYIL